MKRFIATAILSCASALMLSAQPFGLAEGTLDGRVIHYQTIGGQAVLDGDILLTPAEQPKGTRAAAFRSGSTWPQGLVPYEISPEFAEASVARIEEAVDAWNAYGSAVRFVPRSGEAGFVRFVPESPLSGACFSAVGYSGGGEQTIAGDCSVVTFLHEMGHTAGMWHEQQRDDRNRYITVLRENVSADFASQFDFRVADNIGPYDFGSIMHYSAFSFSANGDPVMETVPPGIPIGEAQGLSARDLDAIDRVYGRVPEEVTISSTPPGLTLLVDGEPVTTPAAFFWPPGGTHTLEAPEEPQVSDNFRYRFVRWAHDQPRRHTVIADSSTTVYIADFTRDVPVTATAGPGGSVSVSPASLDGFYPSRTRVKLSAVPDEGFRFYRWAPTSLDDRERRVFCPFAPTASNPVILGVNLTAIECTAEFVQSEFTTIDSDPPHQPVIVDGSAYYAPVNFQFEPGSEHTVGVRPFSATGSRVLFEGWSDGGDEAHTIVAGEGGEVLTAHLRVQYSLTLSRLPKDLGTLVATPASEDGYYDAGTVVTIEADLEPGLVLVSWLLDLKGRANPATLVMDRERAVAARVNVTLPPLTVVNAFSFTEGDISPGEILTIFGENLGPEEGAPGVIADGRVQTEAAGTRVLFDNTPAPVLYTSAEQVNVVAPYDLAGKDSVVVAVEYNGIRGIGRRVPVVALNPAIVAGASDRVVAVDESGALVGPENPARAGSVIVLWATGAGVTDPAGVDGKVSVPPLEAPAVPVSVRIGGRPAKVLYAGNAPLLVAGAMQINVRVPEGVVSGEASVYLVAGDAASDQLVTIPVE